MPRTRTWIAAATVIVIAGLAYFAWTGNDETALPPGFASGNGRIEATEINISSRVAGRIAEVAVREGDFVEAGQLLVQMDTSQLTAMLRQAEAQHRRAVIAIDTARAGVIQRQAEKEAAEALLAQREAEQEAARRQFARTEELAAQGTASQQVLDQDRARFESARAAVAEAGAQIAAADAAISTARSQVVDAEAAVDAAKATIEQIQADIDDSALVSPRAGRVQYRIALPGEVVAAGAPVINMVDLEDVYMTFFLPTAQAGRLAIGSEARLVLDAAPQYVIPATVSFVASVAQFTPKTVETEVEREKLMFRVRAHIDPKLLRRYIESVKAGLPGVAYVRLDPKAEWPPHLSREILQ